MYIDSSFLSSIQYKYNVLIFYNYVQSYVYVRMFIMRMYVCLC